MNARLRLLLPAALACAALACSACGGGAQDLPAAETAALVSAPAKLLAPEPSAPEPARRAFTPVVAPGEGLELAEESVAEKSEKRRYEISLTFPQLKGRPAANAVRFNRAVRALVAREVRDFKHAYGGGSAGRPWTDERVWEDVYDSLTGRYEVIHFDDDFASLRFDLYTYGRGAAHSSHSYAVLNLDLKSGRVFKLGDIFEPGAGHLQSLAAHSVADLKKQYEAEHRREVARLTGGGKPASHAGVRVPDSDFRIGAGPEADNYRAWNLAAEGVVVSFAACQIGGCADGAKEVLVPYSALGEMLNEGGPAARLNARRPR